MKSKSVLPLAAVFALGAAWTLFSESGKKPLTVNMNPLRQSSTRTTVSVTERPLVDRISELFPYASAVSCEATVCTVTIPADRATMEARAQDLARTHPWLGSITLVFRTDERS